MIFDHSCFVILASLSFGAQCDDGIDAGGATCRNVTRDQRRAAHQQDHRAVGRHIIRVLPHKGDCRAVASRQTHQASPGTRPNNTMVKLWRKIIRSTSPRWAPSAMRMPISVVRSLATKAMIPYRPTMARRSAVPANTPSMTMLKRRLSNDAATICSIVSNFVGISGFNARASRRIAAVNPAMSPWPRTTMENSEVAAGRWK